jgi:Carboxypeptidase regulatory-like domain
MAGAIRFVRAGLPPRWVLPYRVRIRSVARAGIQWIRDWGGKEMRRALRLVVLVVLCITYGLPALAAAQSERGTISGVVTDSTKAGLPGVSLNVTNTATNQTTAVVSSSSGSYSAANLPPGTYRVEATLDGFRTTAVAGIQLSAGATTRVDVAMEIGGVSDVVNVIATASFLQTEDARVATTVSNQLIDQLPLVVGGAMRSVFDLVSTVAESKGTGGSASIGGGQGGGYSASLDGILITTNRNANTTENAFLTPSVEAITEFAVESNGFKPEFGQAAGGAITFASKSGTNRFQGSVYEFLRDESLDARDYFASGAPPVYNQHNYGASGGGPIRRDKTFFFTTYEGFINEVNEASNLLSVQTPEMWTGDFSNVVDQNGRQLIIYDPATTRPDPNRPGSFIRDPFPNNKIPANRFSSLASAYVAMAQGTIVPNQGGRPGTFAYINNNFLAAAGTEKETTHKFSAKVDHQLSSNQRLSYLFNLVTNITQPGASGPVGLPRPFDGATKDGYDTTAHRFSWDITGAKMVNRFSVGINTLINNGYSSNVGGDWASKGICLKGAIDCNKNFGQVTFTEFASWGDAAENGTQQPRWTLKNDLSILSGNHTFKTGATFDLQEAFGFGQQAIAGTSSFSWRETAVPGATSQVNGGGSSMASFLLGYVNNGGTEQIREVRQRYPYFAFYGQDDWRVTNRLVVNYGLRYEFTLGAREVNDKYTDLDPTKPNPKVNNYPGASIFAGFGEGRENKRSLIDDYFGSIAPRLSMSFRVDQKTILRAGVGRSFGRVTVPAGSSHFAGYIGNWRWQAPDNITPAYMFDAGLPTVTDPNFQMPPYLNPSIDNNLQTDWWGGGDTASRPGYYDSWTVSVQRELVSGLTAEIDYNGSYGKDLPTGLITANQVPMARVEELIARVGAANVKALLDTIIRDPAHAQTLGILLPYPQFVDPAIQTTRTVAQALRPFPQYGNIRLAVGGGDKSGTSHYHAVVFKLNQRMNNGLSLQSSYTWSRIMTDSDNFGAGSSLDTARPDLEWSIGALDQTHNIKINAVYELPFGSGRRWLTEGVANAVLGGWRVALTQNYVSGVPLGVTANSALTIFNSANRPNVTGQPWRAEPVGEEFDPRVDLFFNKAAFAMPVGALGNAPRRNPDVRRDWSLNENISVAKTFDTGGRFKVDVRIEVFNLFNRVYWAAPNSNFSNVAFGQITATDNDPRQMQLGLKLYW